MSNNKTKYTGKKINVEWDERLCIHIGECGQSEGDLFVAGRDPWCQPDRMSLDEVIEIVRRCPSGALSFESTEYDIEESPGSENCLMVSYNGPYFVRGDLDIEGATDDMPGVAFRSALCRCGASKNKPFCDNSHEAINFKDYGAVGEKGKSLDKTDGKLTITLSEDGPIILTGNLSIRNSSGCIAWTGKKVSLCRCGASSNKPFCDASHFAADFKS